MTVIAPDTEELLRWPWRVGRKVGRTVYAHPPGARDGMPEFDGYLIGLFDTRELASAAVRAHNLLVGHGDVKG